MSRILITSGPTRQYLDPVRYLTNASSGRMGAALAAAAIEAGHQVVVVSGPVEVAYPAEAEVISVVSTEEMLAACRKVFPTCDGLIAVAAPCDYRPVAVATQKIRKTGGPLRLELVETPDVVAELAAQRKVAMDRRLRPGNRRPADAGDAEARTEELRPDRGQRPGSHPRGGYAGRDSRQGRSSVGHASRAARAKWQETCSTSSSGS